MENLAWLQQVGTFVGTYGLAVFLVVYYVLRMYPQLSTERREWIEEITRLEQLVNPDTRPLTLSQAEVVGDIAIDAYLTRLNSLIFSGNWRVGRTYPPGFEDVPKGYIGHRFFGKIFAFDPHNTDATELRHLAQKFTEVRKSLNSETAAHLSELFNSMDDSAEKLQYQLARLRFQGDSLATPWHMALNAIRESRSNKLKDLDFLDSYERRRFLDFVGEHPEYDQIKDDPDLVTATAERPFGVEELFELTKNIMKNSFCRALGKRDENGAAA